ncbi:MAG: efflux RND transporter periplasmic adaptor subunit, partial [Akkermansia sp.]
MYLRSITTLSTLILAASLSYCQKADTAGQGQQMPPLNVSVMNMRQQDVDLVSTWFGHLRGVEQADIRPEVSGKLLRRVYADGSLVQKGDVLFEIDPSSYQATVDQCAAALAAAEAAVLQARAADDRAGQDSERYGKLVSSGSVSEKNYTDALQTKKETEAALAAAQAQVKQAQAALSNARINLDRCTIRAPFTGLASKSTVSVGDLIALANPTALCTMSSVDPIRVDFSVPGKQMLGKVFRPDFNTLTQTSPIDEFDIILADGQVYEHRGHVAAVDSEV